MTVSSFTLSKRGGNRYKLTSSYTGERENLHIKARVSVENHRRTLDGKKGSLLTHIPIGRNSEEKSIKKNNTKP